MPSLVDDYSRIERAIIFLENNFREQPSLGEIAQSAGLSEYHFQRLFRHWAGISPKRFLQFLTIEYAKKLLEESRSVLDVTYESGLSSPSRLHDLFVTVEAVTPGEFKERGARLKITYGVHPSPFGTCLLATTERGICGLAFSHLMNAANALRELKNRWEGAEFCEDPIATQPIINRIFPRAKLKGSRQISLFLKGTNFQLKVWEALLRIPSGAVTCYEDVAACIGTPRSTRAVGCAVGQNPIAFIIPCHRVIRKMGVLGGYHGGIARKKAMLAWEAGRKNVEGETRRPSVSDERQITLEGFGAERSRLERTVAAAG